MQTPSMEDEIIDGLKKEYTYLASLEDQDNKFQINIETLDGNFAIGTYRLKQEKPGSSGTWFARKDSGKWKTFNVGDIGYWGSCQKFWQNDFPQEMIPDCWDTEKNMLVETTNPSRFFADGFTQKDKEEIKKAHLKYSKSKYKDLNFSDDASISIMVDINSGDYLKGRALSNGVENFSTPFFLAAKVNGIWKVIYDGQEPPHCKDIESYEFPNTIVPTCYIPDQTRKGYFIEVTH